MSFSRARIQRFNELRNEAPPPGTYDPICTNKAKSLVIDKSVRLQENKTASNSTESLSVASKISGNSDNIFKLPQCSRKCVTAKSMNLNQSKVKTKCMTQAKSENAQYDVNHEIADLHVECMNKDKTIQEHEKHIEEMKEQVRKLKMQLEELHEKQTEVEKQHRKDIETMAKLQQEVLDNHDERYQGEIESLRSKLLDLSMEREQEISVRKATEDDLRNRIAEMSEKIYILEAELSKKSEVNEIMIKDTQTRNEQLMTELKLLEKKRDNEINSLEEEKAQLNFDIDDLMYNQHSLEIKLEKKQKVILELQAQLSALQCELDELKAEYNKVIEDSMEQESNLEKKYAEEVNKLNYNFGIEKDELESKYQLEEKHRLELESKIEEFKDMNSFLKQELKDVQRLYKDIKQRLMQAHEELEDANQKHKLISNKYKDDIEYLKKQYQEENLKLKQLLDNTREEYLAKIENQTIAKNKEIKELQETCVKKIEEETRRIKERSDKIVENAEAVTRETIAACRAECEERVRRIIVESDAKVRGGHMNAMIKEATSVVEQEMRVSIERHKSSLSRVEAERTALEEKLAQKDAELTKLSAVLEELKVSAETQESFTQSLQVELDKAETELVEKKAELKALKDQIRAEAAEMVARRKRFDIIMSENQASVAALSKRLIQSYAEVERLQHELKRGEDCIHEHKDLLGVMCNKSQLVHKQVHTLMEEIGARRELLDKLETGNLSEIESLKCIFEAKIQHLQEVTLQEVTKLQEECSKKTSQNIEIKTQLDEMASRLSDAQNMLLRLEERNDAQIVKISKLEVINRKLEEQLKNKKNVTEEENKSLHNQAVQHKIVSEEANARVEELTAKLKCFEEKEDYLQNKILLFEKEKLQWKAIEATLIDKLQEEKKHHEAAESKVDALMESNNHLTKKCQNINEKYAKILGYHSHEQRIKHITQLKEKINRLEQELQTKDRSLEQQQKTIEKLKSEQKRSRSKGKENLLGIPKSTHSTPTSSPHKSLTPLRNRNE